MEIVYLLLVVSGFFFPKRPKGMINNLKSIFRIYHCFQSSKAVINTLMQNELQIEGYNSEF